MAFCRNCGNQIKEGMAFCGQCGTRVNSVPAPSFCRFCGTPVSPGAKFCRGCGNAISASQAPRQEGQPKMQAKAKAQARPRPESQPPAQAKTQAQPGSRRFPWKRVIAAVLIIAIGHHLITDWLHRDGGKPETIVTQNSSGSGAGTGQGQSPDGTETQDGGGSQVPDEWYDTYDHSLEKTWTTEQIASGTFTEEKRTIGTGDVMMTVEEGYLPEDTRAEIRKASGTVDYKHGDVTGPLTL